MRDGSTPSLCGRGSAILRWPAGAGGAITKGEQIAAAQALGADMVYMGTRFIATQEANAQTAYKQMVLEAAAGISSIPTCLPVCTVTTCAKVLSWQGWTRRHCLRATKRHALWLRRKQQGKSMAGYLGCRAGRRWHYHAQQRGR